MTASSSTTARLLDRNADLAERHKLVTTTKAGADLQDAFIAFLRAGSVADAAPQDMLADLMALIPRFQNSLVAVDHGGELCRACASRFAAMLFNEIMQDIRELSDRQAAGRKH